MKHNKSIYLISFLLSLSLILLLEASSLGLLAEDIKVPQKEKIEIELLLSAADNFSGVSSQTEKQEKVEKLQEEKNDEQLETETGKNVEADNNSLEVREETKKQNNKIIEKKNKKTDKKQQKNEQNQANIRDKQPAESNKTEIKKEKSQLQAETENKDKELSLENKKETEDPTEKEDEPPAWLKKLESKAEADSSDVEEKGDKREEFDLESYLAELEKEAINTDTNSEQDKQNSDSNGSSEINNNYRKETDEQSENESKNTDMAQNSKKNKAADLKNKRVNNKVYDLRTGNSEQIKKPGIKNYSQPEYPSTLRKRNIEGEVIVSLRIDKKGNVHDLKINKSSGFDLFDQAALKAVSEWEFQAAVKAEQKVQVIVNLPIRFKLN